jgi:hypothetical protein
MYFLIPKITQVFCPKKKNPLRDIVETAKINLVWAELKIRIHWLYCKN